MHVPSSRGRRPVIYLHVGPMKTGTTYLQRLLFANRDRLADAGLHLPGGSWVGQLRAAQDLMGRGRLDPHIRRESAGAWKRLARDARSTSLPASVISVEFLGGAGRRRAGRVVADLAPADVRVVFTVRDMAAVLPALWQTQVHNGARYGWPEFLHRIERPSRVPRPRRRRPEDALASTRDVPAMIASWARVVGGDHLHVVTVPHDAGDPEVLWRRFASVLGVDPAVAVEPAGSRNSSIGLAGTELVRRLNGHLGRLSTSEYNAVVKEHVALKVLATRAGREGRARLTRDGYDLALRWNAEVRQAIFSSGAEVTGDLTDLPVDPDPEVRARLGRAPRAPSRRRMLRDAGLVARALVRLRRRQARRLARLGVPAAPPPPLDVRSLRRTWAQAADPVDAAARDLAASAREAALQLRRLRRLRRLDVRRRTRPAGALRR